MVSIIGCKRYDTEKAKLIKQFKHNGATEDFSVVKEFYVTEKGNYFCYSYQNGDSAVSRKSERIKPYTKQEFIEYLEKHQEWELLESLFSKDIEDA